MVHFLILRLGLGRLVNIAYMNTYYLNQITSNSSNFTTNTSNILEAHIYNTSNYIYNTSNILQTQITETSNIINKATNSNDIIRFTTTNQDGFLFGDPIELLFKTANGNCNPKINEDGNRGE